MEPYSITCPTCHARLKVRDEAAIGQILGCPKCESMVMVTAPAGTPAAARSAAAAARIGALTSGDLAPSPERVGSAVAASAAGELTQSATVAGRLWLAVAVAFAGVAVAGAGWLALRPQTGGAVQVAREVAAPSQAVASQNDSPSEAEAEPVPAGETTGAAATEPMSGGADASADDGHGAATVIVDSDSAAADEPIASDSSSSESEKAVVAGPQEIDAPAEESSAGDDAANTATDEHAAGEPKGAELANEVDDPDETADDALQNNPDELQSAQGSKTNPFRAAVEARLADRLPSIEFASASLADVLLLLSQLSTLSIELAPDLAEQLGEELDRPITLVLEDVSVAEVLDEAVTRFGLSYSIEDERVIVGAKRAHAASP